MPIPLGILAVAGAGAGGAASSFDLLETVTPTGTDTVTFSGLGSYSDYKHLQIRAVARHIVGRTANDTLRIRFNGDTGTNYAQHFLFGDGSAVDTAAGTGNSLIELIFAVVGGNATADAFGASIIDILDFSNSSKNTTTRALVGSRATLGHIALESGLWLNTAAVTSITLISGQGQYASGSRLSLYGIK